MYRMGVEGRGKEILGSTFATGGTCRPSLTKCLTYRVSVYRMGVPVGSIGVCCRNREVLGSTVATGGTCRPALTKCLM